MGGAQARLVDWRCLRKVEGEQVSPPDHCQEEALEAWRPLTEQSQAVLCLPWDSWL